MVSLMVACAFFPSNLKKFFNHLDIGSKDITLGEFTARLSSVRAVASEADATIHGMKTTDCDANRNRQAVPPIERMISEVHVPLGVEFVLQLWLD